MSSLNLDFSKLAGQLMPPFLRQERHLSWVRTLLHPLIWLNEDVFVAWADETRKDLLTTGQVMVLEYRLNERYYGDAGEYDYTVGRWRSGTGIYIDEGERVPKYRLFFRNENQPQPFDLYFRSEEEETAIYFRSEYANDLDFIVKVPAALAGYDENEMKAYVKRYALAGKRFAIETY